MKQIENELDWGAVPHISTMNTLRTSVDEILNHCLQASVSLVGSQPWATVCSWWGWTRIDRRTRRVEITVVTYVIRSKTISANDNFAPSELRLAA